MAARLRGPAPAGFRASGQSGTRVEVRELFFATPARLKFLKSARSEDIATTDVVKRLAMARPDVAFTLTLDGRRSARSAGGDDPASSSEAGGHQENAGRLKRLAKIMGREFGDNALAVDAMREGVHLDGFAGLPTYNRANAQMQFLFVNGRPVRDKLLIGAVRGAYADFLARDRHPALALFLDCDPAFVDVNVHPAKTEVRFRDAGLVRGLIVSALKHALAEAGHRASTTVAGATLVSVAPARRAGLDQSLSGAAAFAGSTRGCAQFPRAVLRRRTGAELFGQGRGHAGKRGAAARPAARPCPRAAARNLCRCADGRRHRHRRSARRP